MQTIGDYLKSEREARNISLSEVSHWTKVSEYYLDWLEKDDYEKIPEGPYIKGYISSYAAYIGISTDEALKRFDSSQRDRNKTNEMLCEISEDKKRQRMNGILKTKRAWSLSGFTICFLKIKKLLMLLQII